MIEVFPEIPFADLFGQILVGCGYQQYPAVSLLIVAEADKAAVIEKAEQLYLGFRVGIADFVKKDNAAAGLFQNPLAVSVCAGKRPFFVAEQF